MQFRVLISAVSSALVRLQGGELDILLSHDRWTENKPLPTVLQLLDVKKTRSGVVKKNYKNENTTCLSFSSKPHHVATTTSRCFMICSKTQRPRRTTCLHLCDKQLVWHAYFHDFVHFCRSMLNKRKTKTNGLLFTCHVPLLGLNRACCGPLC